MTDQQEKRLALIPALAENSPQEKMGRTALMKFMYFLQILRRVPLGYRFSLYSYGPFDSTVLYDLSVAESLGAVEVETVFYPGGYGYDIRAGEKAEWLKRRTRDFFQEHRGDVRWVTKHFGHRSSAQLELMSTLIYVDREAALKKKSLRLPALARQVQEIKPHFSEEQILEFAQQLSADKLLQAAH